ncbi:MAG: hypothetical protein H7Z41_09965 [Cytophagales bacterium]|nr:hypothetical protein [Armatimonadota bacterium]
MADFTPRFFLNSFQPICGYASWKALHASDPLVPPFVDGSCRREPDLEHTLPSISALCRAGKFAPKLRLGDIVAYISKQGCYGDVRQNHYRLVSVLLVKERFSSHEEAQKWYGNQGLTLPKNCMVQGNEPLTWEQTHQAPNQPQSGPKIDSVEKWDAEYKKRQSKHENFLACEALYTELWQPKVIWPDDLRFVFDGAIPGTQNPGKMRTVERLINLVEFAGIGADTVKIWVERAEKVSKSDS